MKLLGSTENKITKDKNSENVPHLEITEVILVHCNIVNSSYQQDSRDLYTLVPINHLVVYWQFYQQIFFFSLYILKYGLQIKIVNYYEQKME